MQTKFQGETHILEDFTAFRNQSISGVFKEKIKWCFQR